VIGFKIGFSCANYEGGAQKPRVLSHQIAFSLDERKPMIDMRGAFDKTRFNWWIALPTPPSRTNENAVRRPKALSSKNAVASIRHLGSHPTNRILKRFWQRSSRWKKK